MGPAAGAATSTGIEISSKTKAERTLLAANARDAAPPEVRAILASLGGEARRAGARVGRARIGAPAVAQRDLLEGTLLGSTRTTWRFHTI